MILFLYFKEKMDDIILENLINKSLDISLKSYELNEILIKIIYLNIDVRTISKEKFNIALSEIIAEIYSLKLKEIQLSDDINKIKIANKIIKNLKNNEYKRNIINKCLKYI